MLAYGPILLTFVVLGLMRSTTAANVGIALLCTGALWLLASAIYQFRLKRSTRGIVMISVTFGGMVVAFVVQAILSMAMTMIDGDHWADNLTIPDGIPMSEPLGERPLGAHSDSVLALSRHKPDLQLYKSFQPGIYTYDVWLQRTDKGVVYLKAYEISQERALSIDRLIESSLMEVYNPTDSVRRFKAQTDFTIYEGDWSKPYAARFEVWFKADIGGSEVKLLEENYKIEGWMH